MNRNSDSYFSKNPARVDMPRSILPRDQELIFTGKVGDVIPFYLDEVLPGSTHSVDTAKVMRLQTPITPFFGDMFCDYYYFFVPNRLVWEHWQEFCGENKTSAWIPEVEYSIPQIKSPTLNGNSVGWLQGSIADYLGIPTGVPNLSVSALPFRAVALCMNEFFRDENLTDPLNIPLGDSDVTPAIEDEADYINGVAQGMRPFRAAKTFDYFTAALPGPQKLAQPVSINLSSLTGMTTPVVGNGSAINFVSGQGAATIIGSNNGSPDFRYSNSPINTSAGTNIQNSYASSSNHGALGLASSGSNIYADMSSIADTTLMTINQLRQAFQVQKFYERMATGGSRYIEILKSMFGVTSPDARLQRPEYLGGNRVPINISQVVQTSQTSTTPQGNVTAMSFTTDYHSDFTKSFVEHGYIIGFAVVRYKHVYQQGIERMWSRKTKFDFYWPLFANLGAQPILNKEIYAQGDQVINNKTLEPYDEEVFGYQEAWAEYRYKPSRVSSEMRSNYNESLDVWHLADDYSNLPSLSDEWIREDYHNVDRVIAVSQKGYDSMLFDILVKNKTTQPMPVYSIPGLVDHH